MHKTFGERENVKYVDRVGAYIIFDRDGKIGVVRTPKGYFLLGGGIENGESHKECIIRECVEEAGLSVEVGDLLCTAESYGLHSEIGYFHPYQYYYSGSALEMINESSESDHVFEWVDYKLLRGNMFSKMQNWALENYLEHAGLR